MGVAASLELEPLAEAWQRSLDAADRLLHAAAVSVPAAELGRDERALDDERRLTSQLLAEVAHVAHVPVPWLAPFPVTPALLGLPPATQACLFDLDGVLTDSGVLHARAWGHAFDDFVGEFGAEHGLPLVRFTLDEYRAYLAGRPRLDGVHAFLRARGITVPDETAHELARRKANAFERALRRQGTSALPGARRYLEAAGRAGLQRAVISASASTDVVLRLARLDDLVEVRIDAETFRSLRLRPWPAPDTFLAACRLLEAEPERSVAFAHASNGVAAATGAGVPSIAVGADAEVRSLEVLLDRRIAEATAR
jgi:beta-phosphoglucomutase-like phosphatase (HAD superfamily)